MKWRQNNKGQTSVEYLLLLTVAFISSYLVIMGPVASFTTSMILRLRSAMGNIVQNADLVPGQVVPPGDNNHPGSPKRLRRLH